MCWFFSFLFYNFSKICWFTSKHNSRFLPFQQRQSIKSKYNTYLNQERARLCAKLTGKCLRQLKAVLERYKNLQHSKNKLVLRKKSIAIFSHIPPICLKYEKCVHQKHLGRKRNIIFTELENCYEIIVLWGQSRLNQNQTDLQPI